MAGASERRHWRMRLKRSSAPFIWMAVLLLQGNLILAQAHSDLAQLAEEPIEINPKGQLQELLQSISPRSPVYELISQSGPEHEKTFVVQAVWEGNRSWPGQRSRKKQAETAAALEALQLKRWEKEP